MLNSKLQKKEHIMHLNLDYTTVSMAIPSSYKHMYVPHIKVPLTKRTVVRKGTVC